MATGHKYRAGTASDYEWHYQLGHPRITAHVEDRWNERMPADARSPEFAYVHGVRDVGIATHPHFVEYRNGDEIRPDAVTLYAGMTGTAEYVAVLLERTTSVVTAYRAESIRHVGVRQYVEAVAREHGVVLE